MGVVNYCHVKLLATHKHSDLDQPLVRLVYHD